VRLSGAGLTLAFDTPANPDVNGAWTSFIVPLSEAGWHVGSIGGAPATQAQMQSVLAAITALHIRAEYKTGADTDFIDNVILEGDTLFSTIDNACGSDLPAGLFPTGTLEPLSLISLTLVGAQPNAQAVLMLGVQQASLMRLGCSLVFVPDVSVPGTTDANGSQELIGRWPSGLPSGFTIFAQTFILAASLPKGFQTTNTVVMTAP
jgi:hypothetical protein